MVDTPAMSEQPKPPSPRLVWIAVGPDGETAEPAFDEVAVVITDNELSELGRCEMHIGSAASGLSLDQVDEAVSSFIRASCDEPPPLCGEGITSTRSRLRVAMPKTIDAVHYRIVNLATFRELANRWYASPARTTMSGKAPLERIRASIGELREHRTTMFRRVDENA